jgi:hypothetical protein
MRSDTRPAGELKELRFRLQRLNFAIRALESLERLCQGRSSAWRPTPSATRPRSDDFLVGPACVFHRLGYGDLIPLRLTPNQNRERHKAIDLLLHGDFLLRPQQ